MHQDPLRFPWEAYTVLHFEADGQPFAVRAWEGLHYCTHPADDIQLLNLYAPEDFFSGGASADIPRRLLPSFCPTPWADTSPARRERQQSTNAANQIPCFAR